MSLGYCEISTVSLNPSANDRQLVDSSLPSSLKFFGFSFGITRVSTGQTANTVQRFKLFDGPSSSDPFWTVALPTSTTEGFSFQPCFFIVTDDSYISVDNGLYYEVTSADLSSSSFPFLVNTFYMG